MRNNERLSREPLFHVTKRSSITWQKSVLVRILSVIVAFLFAGILSSILIGVGPIDFIKTLFNGVFGTERRTWITLRNVSILLCIAVALAPAFKMKFWNIGAEGQVTIGALACAMVMYYCGKTVPAPFIYILMFLAGIVAGAIWAVIPAIFKAFWNTNETLFTLMMNYVAIQLVSFFTNVWVKDGSGVLKNSSHLNGIKIPQIYNQYLLTILVAVLLAVLMFIYLKYTKHGYEVSVVGESENTAKYIGVNVKKVIIRTMAISGALCGLVGVLLTGAINGTVTTSVAGGQGFTAIIVAWVGKFNPLFMFLTSFLITFLDRGIGQLALTNDAFSLIITGVVVFIVIGFEFFTSYKLKARPFTEKEKSNPVIKVYIKIKDFIAKIFGIIGAFCSKIFNIVKDFCLKMINKILKKESNKEDVK